MKLTTAIKQTLKYFALEGCARKQPKLRKDEVIADLHCHPNINNLGDLLDTVRVCKRNKVGLCAIIQHYKGANPHDSKEMSYWQVLELAKESNLPIKVLDKELSFELYGINFIGGYELYGTLKDVKGRLDLVTLMPDEQFHEKIKIGESVKNLIAVCKEHKAIVIGAHPYTVWDPWLFGKVPFRLAYEEEREVIKEEFFSWVENVDCPASNALWMLESNRLVRQDYHYKNPICTSDTHAKRRSVRKEIGRGGIVFNKKFLKGNLRVNLGIIFDLGDYVSYEGYMPALQFLGSIVL